MADELIDIFDENQNHVGTCMKSRAHNEGLWHKVIHCWIIKKDKNNQDKIWFQLRSKAKKLSSNLLCVSSSGHLQAGETVEDGVREIEEEIGLKVNFSQLKRIFTNKVSFKRPDIFNQEFEEVYILKTNETLESLNMQSEEVDGMYEANIKDVISLMDGKENNIVINGYFRNDDNSYKKEQRQVSIENFVPHGTDYYIKVMRMADDYLNRPIKSNHNCRM